MAIYQESSVDPRYEGIEKPNEREKGATFQLVHLQVQTGSMPTATVQLITPDGSQVEDAATGNGPVDAIYTAIDRVVGAPNILQDYDVHSVSSGKDAAAEVIVRIKNGWRIFVGRDSDTDILLASAKAYLNALNQLVISVGVPGGKEERVATS